VGAAGGAYWPIPALIAVSGLIGFACILLVRPAVEMPPKEGRSSSYGRTPERAGDTTALGESQN
jgi:hypothetical protein